MKTYKKPISILVEVEAESLLAGSPQHMDGNGDDKVIINPGTSTSSGDLLPEGDGFIYGNSKESAWE